MWRIRIITLVLFAILATSMVPYAGAISVATEPYTDLQVFSLIKGFTFDVLELRPTKIIVHYPSSGESLMKFTVYSIDTKAEKVVMLIKYSLSRRCIVSVEFKNGTGLPVRGATDIALFLKRYLLFYEKYGIKDKDLREIVTAFIKVVNGNNGMLLTGNNTSKEYRVGDIRIYVHRSQKDYVTVSIEKLYKVNSVELPLKGLYIVIKDGKIVMFEDYVTGLKASVKFAVKESDVKRKVLEVLMPVLVKHNIRVSDLTLDIKLMSVVCRSSGTVHVVYFVQVTDRSGKLLATVKVDCSTGNSELVKLKVLENSQDSSSMLMLVSPLVCAITPLLLGSFISNIAWRRRKEEAASLPF